jgi:hypothetical protein
MTRYFSMKQTVEPANSRSYPILRHTLSAISSNPNKKGQYPVAMMRVAQRVGNEYPNFEFNKSDDEILDMKERLREHNYSTLRKVSRDSGRPFDDYESVTSDDFENIDSAAYYLEQHGKGLYDAISHRGTPYGRDARKEAQHAGIQYAKEISKLRKIPNQLFSPDSWSGVTVEEANAHPSMRHSIPIMASHFNQQYGDLTAAESLSRHSSKLVNRAKARGIGVVKDSLNNPKSKPNNPIDFNPHSFVGKDQVPTERNYVDQEKSNMLTGPYTERELHPTEIASAKQNLRTLLGRPASKPLSNQFDQPKLPGMEN